MKALIWIIIIGAIAWGVWYFMNDDAAALGPYGNAAGQVEGASDANGNGFDLELDGSTEVDVKG